MIKIFTILLSGLVAMILLQTIIRVILRKLRTEADNNARTRPSYGLYFAALLLGGAKVLATTMTALSDAVDLQLVVDRAHGIVELARLSLLFTGAGLLWLTLWFVIASLITRVTSGIRQESGEMKLDNIYYFVGKGVLLLCLIWIFEPVLLLLLRNLMPEMPVPLIH